VLAQNRDITTLALHIMFLLNGREDFARPYRSLQLEDRCGV
jgi:hypothetical protein